MSAKRAATTELNHENWDQEDPSEHEEMGSFKTASKDVLEKRVIRTAKRRAPIGGNDESKKGVFSGFGGFNKSQPSSFDFLANLTNGNKASSSPVSKSDTAVTSSLFSNKPLSSTTGSGIFGSQVSSTPTKSTFGVATSQSSPLFGSSTNTQAATSIFTASKADSTVGDSPYKTQPVSSSNEPSSTNSSKITTAISNPSGSQVTSTIFGAPNGGANVNKSLFSNTNSSTPFKIQSVSSSTTVQSNFGVLATSATESKANESAEKTETPDDDKKIAYYTKLKGLNESVSDWIKKHVEETPLCILTPIFRDYEKYLKEMQDEYHGTDKDDKSSKGTGSMSEVKSSGSESSTTKQSIPFAANNLNSSPFSKTDSSPNSKPVTFGLTTNGSALGETPKTTFSFGINNSTSTTTTSAGFSFGISTTQTSTTTATSPFSSTTGISSATSPFSATSTANSNGPTAPFSFGIGKPFSFNSNVQKPASETTENTKEDEDEPPKVEFTPVVEENSVFDKKCKIFVKKDGNFVDKGVGTLYIKKVEDSSKHQLLVRANTNLGNVLVNLILSSAIPTQRMGKNNVMLVCIPTPDAKPPPTPILIRVKTTEEADELLETLDKYKS
ncbi:nuclear pore complex protein Nup50 [Ostrinia nubilalis]|uniref:nuclear pore complex protein Nup50 n=1 Tax=Ostrinia nubilalis TaxID=29057 RepID=UPI0030822157